MTRFLFRAGTPILFSLALAMNPALADEERKDQEGEGQVPPSVLDEPTAEGSSKTDPWVGRDRIPPDDPAPTGMQKEYRLLGEDDIETGATGQETDPDDVEQLESPAAGRPQDPEPERLDEAEGPDDEDKFFGADENADEYEREWPVGNGDDQEAEIGN